jgi:predicted RNase H-like nuclease (RuvC/YqgF family)
MDSNYADKRSQISELQSLRDLVKRQTDQIAMLKEQLRDATSEERGDYHQRRELVKEVQFKNAEIEEIKRKAKTRKEKCRILKRENATLKNALRDVEIRSSSANVHQ